MGKTERVEEVAAFASLYSVEQTAEHYGLNTETVNRYIRKAKEVLVDKDNPPKIVTFDIETLPIISANFSVWNVNIPPVNILQDWTLLSYSYKWLTEEDVDGDILTQNETWDRDDKRLTEGIWEILDEADVVIGFNSVKFDERKLNAKFIEHGLGRPSPYKSIDLYVAARKMFANTFNKMDWVNKIVGVDRKLQHTGMKLWIDCHYALPEALDKMMEYNLVDTEITEQLYIRMLEWIPQHPNMALYYSNEEPMCHKCASTDVVLTDKKHYTAASVFELYKCPHCNSYSRFKKRVSTTDLRPA